MRTVHKDKPVIGYKSAFLRSTDGKIHLASIVNARPCAVDEDATCTARIRAMIHEDKLMLLPTELCADMLNCSCGFYSFKKQSKAYAYGQSFSPVRVFLKVHNSGQVIECTNGYRSEHQKVTAILVHSTCAFCDNAVSGLILNKSQFNPSCGSCAQETHSQLYSLADVAEQLGVPVGTADLSARHELAPVTYIIASMPVIAMFLILISDLTRNVIPASVGVALDLAWVIRIVWACSHEVNYFKNLQGV